MSSRINDIYIMQCNSMYYFFSLKNFSFWTLSKSCLRRNSIIFTSSCKTSSNFCYFASCFINVNHIASCYFFFLYLFNHFCSQIIYAFHIGCFKSQFTDLICLCFLYLNINNFAFYNLCFFFYSNANRSSKGLCKTLSLTHL